MGKPEAIVEVYLKNKVESIGGICYKFSSPSRRNVPDRLCAFRLGVTAFVECKAEKGVLSRGQVKEFDRLANLGHIIAVVHTKAEVDEFIDVIKGVLAGGKTDAKI